VVVCVDPESVLRLEVQCQGIRKHTKRLIQDYTNLWYEKLEQISTFSSSSFQLLLSSYVTLNGYP
jgi:hypothetical protein